MYIKYIIMEGFKSYREKTVVGPLCPAQNVVVGRNGAGKSSLFTAGLLSIRIFYTGTKRIRTKVIMGQYV